MVAVPVPPRSPPGVVVAQPVLSPAEIERRIDARGAAAGFGPRFGRVYEQTFRNGRAWLASFPSGTVYLLASGATVVTTTAMNIALRGDSFAPRAADMGFPLEDERTCNAPNGSDRYQVFAGGVVFWRAARNRYELQPGMAPPTTLGDCRERLGPVGAGLPTAATTGAALGASGRYRVTLVGFQVDRQTSDDPLNRDGWADEIYATVTTARFVNGDQASVSTERSIVMGDSNRPASEEPRLRAGSATDHGGLQTGDSFRPASGAVAPRPTVPWVLFEGSLAAGRDAVVLVPVLWEWDEPNAYGTLYSFQNRYFGQGSTLVQNAPRSEFFYDSARLNPGARPQPWIASALEAASHPGPAQVSQPIAAPAQAQTRVRSNGDQPIGARESDRGDERLFWPKMLILTQPLAERIAATIYPLPAVGTAANGVSTTVEPLAGRPGIVPIRYAGDDAHGDYTLFVRIERLP